MNTSKEVLSGLMVALGAAMVGHYWAKWPVVIGTVLLLSGLNWRYERNEYK